jgi:hypothetical protein
MRFPVRLAGPRSAGEHPGVDKLNVARKVAVRAGGNPASHTSEPKRGRLRLFLLLVLAAGAGSGIAALMGNSLLIDVQTLVIDVHDKTVVQTIDARTLFPTVPPVHKTVDVYDPAPAAGPGKPQPGSAPTPSPRPSPSPSHRARQSPSPCPSGGCPDN